MPASVRERSPGAAHLPPPLDAASHEPPATARARRAVEVHVPPSPGRARLVAAYAAATRPAMVAPSAAELAARLGRYRERMSGPYQVRGASVAVPAAFRMVGGMNQASSQKCMAAIAKALGPEAFRAVRVAAAQVTMGKGTPEQVRALTQALIGSPAFAAYAKLPSAQAVRHLMWDFGIGVDCSGYVHHAFLYSRGAGDAAAPSARYGLGAAELSGLQSLPGPHFRRVSPALARPGDVIKLSQGDDGTGHKVIVTARDELTASDPRYAA
ncbi:MAG: hypothetical protein OZ928_12320, partial [Polyangiaceae bacterium]|nr:hypothetical protein [Polyangiaceae bacterium]